jgi:Ser/Thr protein kinase RdoA (MazF antagonist)
MSIATVHSMRADLVPTDWPRLTPEDVFAVVGHWVSALSAARLIWHSPRPLSAAAIVDVDGRRLFLKRHHRTIRTAAELEEEHRFIGHLRSRGAPVSDVRASTDGATAVELGEFTYELHGLGAGIDLYRDAVSWSPFASPEHAVAAGRSLGLLHISSAGFDAPPRSAALLVSNDRIIRSTDPLRVIQELLAVRPTLQDYFRQRDWRTEIARALRPFHDRFLDVLPHLQPLWTHNDWHASNLLWSDSSATATVRTVFDFGLCDRTTAVYDLATAIERNAIPWLDIHEGIAGAADLALVSALLRGYQGARPLDSWERAALVAVLPLAHIGYALTEVDYFHGTTRSEANANLAYDGFLLGHCAWFDSAQGRALLDHVHRELGE